MTITKITDFKGVFTNGDTEEIPAENCVLLQDFRPYNGQLIKTFGFGAKIDERILSSPKNIATFVNRKLTSNGLSGYIYLAVIISASAYTVVIQGYDETAEAWSVINAFDDITLSGAYYAANEKNPVVYDSEVIRFLPGFAGNPDGTNEAKGIWLGYIDRDFFDGLYLASNYTAQIFALATEIGVFGIVPTTADLADFSSGYLAAADEFYKLTYLYDGIQESLLNKHVVWNLGTDDDSMVMTATITNASHNKRITAIKIYHADTYNGTYSLIQTVDLLRESADYYGNNRATNTLEGVHHGHWAIYAPGASEVVFDETKEYRIVIDPDGDNVTKEIDVTVWGNGSGFVKFPIIESEGAISGTQYWSKKWRMEESTDSFGAVIDIVASGTADCYCGDRVLIIDEDVENTDDIVGLPFKFNDGDDREWVKISATATRAIQLNATPGDIAATGYSNLTNKPWHIFYPLHGMYCFEQSGSDSVLVFVDNGLIEGSEHPLSSEKYIKVNGRYAKAINGRLWQGYIILDPGNKNEEHIDWISYSELDKLDVTPVSNVIQIRDEEIGTEITGVEELFGNPVILKKQAIITILNTKSSPGTPSSWATITSSHNIGNVAQHGSLVAMDRLFVCSFDGIYLLTPNNLAESDSTPTERLRVSEAINDVYLALTLTQKEAIISTYDQYTSEAIFKLGSAFYAYNINTGDWRTITTDLTPDIFTYSEEARVLGHYSRYIKELSGSAQESRAPEYKTRVFAISNEDVMPINQVSVTYYATAALTLELFLEGSSTAATSWTLPANSVMTTRKVKIGFYSARKFQIGIKEAEASSTTTVKINSVLLEYNTML